MLRRDAVKSVSICDGFRKRDFFHMGRGFLPLLAVMLLATPQLAFAQNSLPVTVNPRSLDIDEGRPTGDIHDSVGHRTGGGCDGEGGWRAYLGHGRSPYGVVN